MPFIRTYRAKGKPKRESLALLDLHIDRAGVRELAFTRGARRGRIRVGLLAAEKVAHLAGRLAAARGIHLFLERVEADGAHHDIAAHDVARRAVEPERVGELEALLD